MSVHCKSGLAMLLGWPVQWPGLHGSAAGQRLGCCAGRTAGVCDLHAEMRSGVTEVVDIDGAVWSRQLRL